MADPCFLNSAHQRFKLQILCYCLMGNHYHLLVKTPDANLGRAMRHINGLYTRRYNRLRKMDGTLFRGRYKAILVEEDSHQLQLSRYSSFGVHKRRQKQSKTLVKDAFHAPNFATEI